VLREGVVAFIDDNAISRGAAIAFYAMTAIVPTLYISAAIGGLVLGDQVARSGIVREIGRVVGHDTAAMLQKAAHSIALGEAGWWSGIVGVVVLVLTAGGVFVEVQAALNAIWKAAPPKMTVWRFLRSWVESLAMVVGLGVLLSLSVVVNALVNALGSHIPNLIGMGSWLVWLLNFGVSSTLIALLLGTIYMVLPNRNLEWRDVVVGTLITTVLIAIGEYLIAFYLATSALSHRYGAVGGSIAVLMWIYYSVQVFLLGAEITKVWSSRYGSRRAGAARLGTAP